MMHGIPTPCPVLGQSGYMPSCSELALLSCYPPSRPRRPGSGENQGCLGLAYCQEDMWINRVKDRGLQLG